MGWVTPDTMQGPNPTTNTTPEFVSKWVTYSPMPKTNKPKHWSDGLD